MEQFDNIRLYYENQSSLGKALRDYIDLYFQNKIQDEQLEAKIMQVIENNKEKYFTCDLEVASRIKVILGKTRLDVLNKIIANKGGITR
jgi:uncharacterized protein (TIGR04540 family)